MTSIEKIKHILSQIKNTKDHSILDQYNLTLEERSLILSLIEDDLVDEAMQVINTTNPEAVLRRLKTDLNIKTKTPKLRKHIFKYAALLVVLLTAGYFGLQTILSSSETLQIESKAITLELEDGTVKEIHLNENLEVVDSTGSLVASQSANHITYLNNPDNKISYNTLKVPYGKTFQLILSDGTEVDLNSGTSIKFPVHFSNIGNREVYLNGEAHFKVSKNKEQPFIVNTNNSEIEVLGTVFNVMNYDNEINTNTVLIEGRVRFTKQANGEQVVLTPGMMASINKNQPESNINISQVNTLLHTAWIDGRLIYRDLPFKEITKKLERKYNVTIVNTNSKLDNQTFSGNLGDESIYEILTYFKELYSINYQIKDNTIYIN